MKVLKFFLRISSVIIALAIIYVLSKSHIENFILKKIIERLESDSRIAEIVVNESQKNPQTKSTRTTIKFIEYNSKGHALLPRYFTFSDNTIQFMALVIRFENSFVKRRDLLKGRSIYLLTKAFAIHKDKVESYEITPLYEVPDGYSVGWGFGFFEKMLWRRFWRYALSPEAARKEGIKIAQIEAPGMKFIPGLIYTLKIDHAGGLKIETGEIPKILER